MSDFTKTIIAMLLTAVMSNVVTVATLSANNEHVTKSLEKLEQKLAQTDNILRDVQIKQAKQHSLLKSKDILASIN